MRDGGSRHYRSTGRETRFNDQTAGQSPKTPIQYLIRNNESQPSTLSQSRSRRGPGIGVKRDIQLLHNHTILHARSAYEDWPEVERKRHLLRLWLSPAGR